MARIPSLISRKKRTGERPEPLAALVRLLSLLAGDDGDMAKRPEIRRQPKRVSTRWAERWAIRFGFRARYYEVRLQDIPDAALPVLLETRGGEDFVILEEWTAEGEACVRFSDGRRAVVTGGLLDASYAGHALFIRKDEKAPDGLLKKLRRYGSIFARAWKDETTAAIFSAVAYLVFGLATIGAVLTADTVLAEYMTSEFLLPVYGSVVAVLLCLAFTFSRRPLLTNWQTGVADVPFAFVFAGLSAWMVGLAILPLVVIMISLSVAIFTSHRIEAGEYWMGEFRKKALRTVFLVTALPSGVLAGAGHLTLGNVVGGTTFAVAALYALIQSRGIVQQLKMSRFCREVRLVSHHMPGRFPFPASVVDARLCRVVRGGLRPGKR